MRKVIDGNTACADIAYKLSEVATIYPITPSSTMSEIVDVWSAEGKKNIFDRTVNVMQMQSEAGASAAMHGSLSSGALSTTFTSSQGLLLMIPNMYKIAGELLPNVIHVSARTIATHALSIFGDHSDVMSVRQTGYALLASNTVQEAHDFAAISHIATLKSSVPFIHFFDGFRTSHEINTINTISDTELKSIYPYDKLQEFRERGLNSSNPHQQGTAQNADIFFQNREASNTFYNNVPDIVKETMNDIYKITGRKYNLFDYVGHENAEDIIIMMGSGASTVETTIKHLSQDGHKLGLIKVRLFRPFSINDFTNIIPKSAKTLTVLDRTKEPGSAGEPLYKDIISALFEKGITNIKVLGGRYGLSGKEFTPTMVKAVYDNAQSNEPKNHFTVGIQDDITFTSLPMPKNQLITCEGRLTSCKFYGFGGDGTVSANKSTIKIIGENTNFYTQGYFEYDSKKSGNSTIAHLRFGKHPIDDPYLLNNIHFVACHNQSYLTKFNLLKDVREGATFLLNTNYPTDILFKVMPDKLKKQIAEKKIKFYTIDAYGLAIKNGLGPRINLIMQTAFFKLSNLIDFDLAKQEIIKNAKKAYEKSGPEILQKNINAIKETEMLIKNIDYDKDWININIDTDSDYDFDKFNHQKINSLTKISTDNNKESLYYKNYINPIQSLDGDKMPVSMFDPAGLAPIGTSKLEKRGISTFLPCWESENCIQCNLCAFVCPHAAIRPYLVKEEDIKDAPENIKFLDATLEKGMKYKVQLNPMDCTGCGVCVNVCPTRVKALVRTPAEEIRQQENEFYEYMQSLEKHESKVFPKTSVKGIGFVDPLFEFSGACAGCGETPYIKVLTQMFGNKMIMANATGCSSIYGGTAPACPYTKDKNGNGVAWANSLFEDNAEFGLGIKLGEQQKHHLLREKLTELVNLNLNEKLNEFVNEYLNETDTEKQRTLSNIIITILEARSQISDEAIIKEVLQLKNSFVEQSVWIVGGDGWAYDIGYGGLDHVLASGQDVNILVLDTEVYSNTGGQASKATPLGAVAKFASNGKRSRKKDLALLATMYKDVYVAKISMGANPAQVIKAFNEAEKHKGVSLIIAYSPCIEHGIDMQKSQESMKLAVETGYWHLWRYNPALRLEGKNPFVLDSQKPTRPLKDFLLNESRYKVLINKQPDLANQLFETAQSDADETYNLYKKLSQEVF